jgi:hypothetical protein
LLQIFMMQGQIARDNREKVVLNKPKSEYNSILPLMHAGATTSTPSSAEGRQRAPHT